MQQISYFVQKYKYFLLFFSLEIVAMFFTIQYKAYQKSQFINSTNDAVGEIYNYTNSWLEYLSLRDENLKLAKENTELRNALELKVTENIDVRVDTTVQKYVFVTAKVINNSFLKRNNYITLNKGTADGVRLDMGVINGNGIIGIVNNVSAHYATVLTILNSQSKINVRLKNSNYFGTLSWNGKNYRVSQLIDIQRQAPIKVGDTIESDGKSILFPEGIPIGKVKDLKMNFKQYEQIDIELFNDMSNLNFVHVINSTRKKEVEQLEERNE